MRLNAVVNYFVFVVVFFVTGFAVVAFLVDAFFTGAFFVTPPPTTFLAGAFLSTAFLVAVEDFARAALALVPGATFFFGGTSCFVFVDVEPFFATGFFVVVLNGQPSLNQHTTRCVYVSSLTGSFFAGVAFFAAAD